MPKTPDKRSSSNRGYGVIFLKPAGFLQQMRRPSVFTPSSQAPGAALAGL
jgi:hypothetical protein